MTVINEKFSVNTHGFTDIIDITQKVKHAVYSHSLQNAVVHVYVAGSTVSITNIEFEPFDVPLIDHVTSSFSE